jgi:prolyl oligopeptidase
MRIVNRALRGICAAAMGLGCMTDAIAQAPAPAADPYLWLEEVSSPRALGWVGDENKRTLGILEGDARFAGLYADALKIAEATDRIPSPAMIGDHITNFWQDAAHVQGIWRATTLDDYLTSAPKWRTLLDLDALSAADKQVWVWKGAVCEPIAERRCLVQLSAGGEDATTVREFDMETGEFVPGGFTLSTSKQDVAWEGADSILVARDWGAGTMTKSGYAFVVKRVTRGQPIDQAVEIYRGTPDDVGVTPTTVADGQGHKVQLLLRYRTIFESEVYRVTPTGVARIDLPPKSSPKGLVAGKLIAQVDQDWMPKRGVQVSAGSIVAVDLDRKGGIAILFAPGKRQSVEEVAVTRGHVLASIYDNVRGQAWSFAPGASGWTAKRLPLPENSSVHVLSTDRTSDRAFLSANSFIVPSTVWLADLGSGGAKSVKAAPARFDATGLVTEQFEATSKDGTKIPYFVVHRRDIALDGSTPTVMTAYGGFQVSMTPSYLSTRGKLWLEKGGAFVLANIRGGGEFGPAWHEAGLKTKRQIIYDDFAAVGEDLITRRITSSRRLGIYGGSNGGLLMGVELTQRPDLWHAVEIQIPLLDMLRYEQLSAGASWVGEYGSVSVPAERAFWEKTSPYQALRPDAKYPMPFIWTTTKDDRVGPVQARKFAARMKEYGLPYLYWENMEGGHDAGANLRQSARTSALETVYFTRMLMDPVEPATAP